MLHKLVNEEMELEMAFDSDPIVHFILVRIWTVKPNMLEKNLLISIHIGYWLVIKTRPTIRAHPKCIPTNGFFTVLSGALLLDGDVWK